MADPPMHGIRARLPKSPRPTPTDYPQSDPVAHALPTPTVAALGLTCLADTGRATALDFVTGLLSLGRGVPRGRLRGLGCHGVDIDRVWGQGQQIRGDAAGLMMATCGRTATLDVLDRPGLPLVPQRISDDKAQP
jgi:hypothetical protein